MYATQGTEAGDLRFKASNCNEYMINIFEIFLSFVSFCKFSI